MEYLNTAQELLDFIMRCKSPFHVVKEASDLLNENGYTKLEETKEWRPCLVRLPTSSLSKIAQTLT